MNAPTQSPRGILLVAWSRLAARGVTIPAALFCALWLGMVAIAWYASRSTDQSVITCMFKRITGYPCATCGGTRAAMSLARGEIGSAIQLNPLATLLVIGAPLLLAWWVLVPPADAPRRRWIHPAVQVAILLAVVIANWTYVLWRFGRGEI